MIEKTPAFTLALTLLLTPPALAGISDVDNDGFSDGQDNCLLVANATQTDTDGDGIGNACDTDLSQDCVVNVVDLAQLRTVFFTNDADADFTGDGQVNFADLGIMRTQFFSAPGPSGVLNDCAEVITIDGRVDVAAAGPFMLEATVDGTASGGGIITAEVMTQADGTFTIDVFAPGDEDFVTLSAFQDTGRIRLTSLLGSFGSLGASVTNDLARGGPQPDAVLSAASTAMATQLQDINGGPITSVSELEMAEAQLNAPEWLRVAGLVQALINDPGIPLPAGITNTQEAIDDPAAFQMLSDNVLLNHLAARDAGVAQVIASLSAPYSSVTPQRYDLLVPDSLDAATAARLAIVGDGSATYGSFQAEGVGTWALTPEGVLRITFPTPILLSESFPAIEDPDNPGTFIQALQRQFLDSVDVVRITEGSLIDIAMLLTTTRNVFPDYPQIPPTTFVGQPSSFAARNVYTPASSLPLAISDFSGQRIVYDFVHSSMVSRGRSAEDIGTDVLSMNADGTGTTERLGFAFDWTVTPEGELQVTFSNGDQTTFTAYSANGPAFFGVLRGTNSLAGTARTVDNYLIIEEPGSALTAADVSGSRWRSGLATVNSIFPGVQIFDWELASNGTGCRNPFSTSTSWFWTLTDSRAVIDRLFNSDSSFFMRRSFETFAREGDDHWVIETLDTFPSGPPANPATIGGRINVYSKKQSLSGNLPPALTPDTVTVPASGSTTIPVRPLLANDIDPEGDEIFFMSSTSTGSLGGSLFPTSVEDAQGLVYTPPAGAVAGQSEVFFVQASDRVCPVPNGAFVQLTIALQ